MKQLLLFITIFLPVVGLAKIDRRQVLTRNNPHVNAIDSLASLSVGNGHFAFTVDATGLQTFPETYRNGIPLGTMSDWGWHSFPNKQQLTTQETLRLYDFGRGRQEPYAVQIKEDGRKKDAANYYRVNPHRLHRRHSGYRPDTRTLGWSREEPFCLPRCGLRGGDGLSARCRRGSG